MKEKKENSIAMLVLKTLKEELEDIKNVAKTYKNVAKEYKKEKKTWKTVAIVFIAVSLALSTYIIFLLDSLNTDVGIIKEEVEDIIGDANGES